jgi:tetratricopeptide (TPR) repeat protein
MPPEAGRHFNDAGFSPPTERISAEQVFALSPAMERYVDTDISSKVYNRGARQALVDALYSKGELRIEYDSSFTRNAAQTFDSRSGNCLSLVIMTAAFAKRLGIAVRYQSLYTDDAIGRTGDLYLSVDHINLSLGKRVSDFGAAARIPEYITVDFIPPRDSSKVRVRQLGESTVVAMFMNNRAVEALGQGRIDDAYWWARGAVKQDPGLVRAYNTLGVVYRRSGDLQRAEQVLAEALAMEPANPQVLGNLVQVVSALGKGAQAEELKARLDRVERESPFADFDKGRVALNAGDYPLAIKLLSKAAERAPDYHEFQYWLAVAYSAVGDAANAMEHLARAQESGTTREQRQLYAAKLIRYRSVVTH